MAAPSSGKPGHVTIDREHDHDGTVVVRSHDRVRQARSILFTNVRSVVSPDGNRIDGEDLFLPAKGDVIPARIRTILSCAFICIRRCGRPKVADGHGVVLVLPNRDLWNFHTYEDVLDLEDGAYLGGQDGRATTLQIVVRGKARQSATRALDLPTHTAARAAQPHRASKPRNCPWSTSASGGCKERGRPRRDGNRGGHVHPWCQWMTPKR